MTIPVVLNDSPNPSSSSLPSSMSMSRDRDLFSRSSPSIAGSRRSSSGALLSLGAVPEHEHTSDVSLPDMPGAANGLPPSSYRSNGVRQTSAPNGYGNGNVYGNGNGNGKGKEREREREASLNGSSVRSSRTPRTPPDEGVVPRRAPWVIDLLEAQRGAHFWGSKEQVILVLGTTSPEPLAPILYNPAFSDTLVIVASPEPQPAIEALTSPSYLLSATPNSEIYPHIQPLSLSSKALVPGIHPLPALLEKAGDIARSFRANRTGSKALGDRRQSSDSLSSLTGTGTGTGTGAAPLTPSKRGRKLSALSAELGKRDSIDSGRDSTPPSRPSSLFDGIGAPRQDSFMLVPGEGSAPSTPRSRMSSFSRNSFVNTIGTIANKVVDSDMRSPSQNSGSAFDAVLNFIPPASDFAAERMLQDMLHGAVVITTGVIPYLVRRQPKPDSVKANPIAPTPQLDVSVIHVLPSLVPRPIPALIESFLLSMLPTIQTGDRDIWASVISTPVWRSPFVDTSPPSSVNGSGFPPQGDDISGAEALLFGGIRCPHYILDGQDEPLKSRAFLGNWNSCVVMPGLLCDARSTPRPRGPSPPLGKLRFPSTSSTPLSMAYDDIEARTPPSSTYDSLLPAPATITSYTVPTQSDSRRTPHTGVYHHHGRGSAPATGPGPGPGPFDSPPVPELDASQSSRSSSSEGARTPAPSQPGTIENEKPSGGGGGGGGGGKKKGGLLGWFKTKTRGVKAC